MKKIFLLLLATVSTISFSQVDGINIETNDMYTDLGIQEVANYEIDTLFDTIMVERVDIYLISTTPPWELFNEVELTNTDGEILKTRDGLSIEDEWANINDSTYRVRLNGFAEMTPMGEQLEHIISFSLQELFESYNLNMYVNIRYYDSNGYTSYIETDSSRFRILNTVGISELKTSLISIYPNPTTESFSVDGLEKICMIEVFNLSGKLVKVFPCKQERYDISELNSGMYILNIYTRKEALTTQIIKKN